MEITQVRVFPVDDEKLKAFVAVIFDDCFVVRDLKIIEGANGPFVAMPSRKLTAHCPGCGSKNHLRAAFCNQCGTRLRENQALKDEEGRAKLYADIAHPINSACRETIQARVIEAFQEEKGRAGLPDYVPSYDDFDGEEAAAEPAPVEEKRSSVEPVQVQPPEEPRGPHKTPSRHPQESTPPADDGFGAGIFE